MRIAVVGGTGVVGAPVVTAVAEAGHEPVVVARSRGVDVTTGDGLDAALADASAVIDVSNVGTLSRRKSVEFFAAASRTLLAAEERAGVSHHVVLSIVGVDRVDSGYYAGKRRQEELVRSGPLPWSVLRATQFHDFAAQVIGRQRGPVVVVPRMRTQPVAVDEVAASLVTLAVGPAVGHAPELAGPQEHELVDMVHRLLRARGQRRLLLPLRLPGPAGRATADGALLPSAPGPRGLSTYDDWLAAVVPSRS